MEYYFIFKKFSIDENQWSFLLNVISIILTIFGIFCALKIYNKQKRDSAAEAYDFFFSNLKDLNEAFTKTIINISEFIKSLDGEQFKVPLLSVLLNDRFIDKVNIVDLARYYKIRDKSKIENFRLFLKDANFFGDYNNYYSSQIEYLQNFYFEKESIFLQWQLLRTYNYSNADIKDEFTKDYSNWISNMLNDEDVFDYNEQSKKLIVKSRKLLVEKHISLIAYKSYKYVLENNQTASEVNRLATLVLSAHTDIVEFKNKLKNSLTSDLKNLERIQSNLQKLI